MAFASSRRSVPLSTARDRDRSPTGVLVARANPFTEERVRDDACIRASLPRARTLSASMTLHRAWSHRSRAGPLRIVVPLSRPRATGRETIATHTQRSLTHAVKRKQPRDGGQVRMPAIARAWALCDRQRLDRDLLRLHAALRASLANVFAHERLATGGQTLFPQSSMSCSSTARHRAQRRGGGRRGTCAAKSLVGLEHAHSNIADFVRDPSTITRPFRQRARSPRPL